MKKTLLIATLIVSSISHCDAPSASEYKNLFELTQQLDWIDQYLNQHTAHTGIKEVIFEQGKKTNFPDDTREVYVNSLCANLGWAMEHSNGINAILEKDLPSWVDREALQKTNKFFGESVTKAQLFLKEEIKSKQQNQTISTTLNNIPQEKINDFLALYQHIDAQNRWMRTTVGRKFFLKK